MERLQSVVWAVLAMLMLGLVLAAPAMAEEEFVKAQWLVGGAKLAMALSAVIEGEWWLRDTRLRIAVRCSFDAEVVVQTNSILKVQRFLNLAGVQTGEPLSGEALLCVAQEGCENSPTDVEVWPASLPWQFELVLEPVSRDFFILGGLEYEVLCLALNIPMSETCSTGTTKISAEVENEVAGVIWAPVAWTPSNNCSSGGAGTGEIGMFAGSLLTSFEGVVQVSE